MKIKIKINILMSIIALILFFISCPGTGSTGTDDPDKEDPKPPETVDAPDAVSATADIEGREIKIVWSDVDGAVSYTLYKKLANGQYQVMKTGVASNSFTYKEYNTDINIFYGVQSVKGSAVSVMKSTIDPLNLALAQAMIPSKPAIKSFAVPDGVIIEWEADLSADSYILYRDLSYNGTYLTKAYEGTGLFFTDMFGTSGQYNYYKLALVMDGVEYGKSQYNFGVAGSAGKDNFEDNNIIEDAVILEPNTGGNPISKYSANIYNFDDEVNNKLIDYDWYYVNVPANTSYTVTIDEFRNIPTEPYETGKNYLFYKEEGKEASEVFEGDEFLLTNNTNAVKALRFQIYTNAANFINLFGGYKITIK